MFVTIHGHFYQPPRENPWTGQIQRQEGAAPFHDWNERIADECYGPNGRSRVLDPQGRITAIVNNFSRISFDFGPTLLIDLKRRYPKVYRQILDGDRESVALHGGHGNAIAQAYSHMILPLANLPDKWTQVRWGLRDFEHRFGRRSEGFWLPETAVDAETLRVVGEAGTRFLILAPHQARRVRPLGERKWEECGAHIDTSRAYRCYTDPGRKRWIDCYFYDGPLSAAASFEHLLRDAGGFAGRLAAAGHGMGAHGLVHMATDGEIYGHHEPFADMCLAYLFRDEAPHRGLRFVNYPEHLDLAPPQHEVQLNFGDAGEGTAWSCAHGVGRWIRDCGCSTGGQAGWNQRWRTPLRRGLEAIRDQIQAAYLTQAGRILRDPWAARDDYIEVLLDPNKGTRDAFLARNLRDSADAETARMVWSLLEATHQAMLMFTSCAWFFADVSGLEVQQNLGYAARACELAQPFVTEPLEPLLLTHLEQAISNLLERGTGADVYRSLVRPRRVGPEHAAAQAVLEATVLGRSLHRGVYGYSVSGTFDPGCEDDEAECGGRLQVTEERLGQSWSWDFRVPDGTLAHRSVTLHPAVDPRASPGSFRGSIGLVALQREVREEIAQAALGQALEDEQGRIREIYQEAKGPMEILIGLSLPLPEIHRNLAMHVLGRRFRDLVLQLDPDPAPPSSRWWEQVEASVEEMRRIGLAADVSPLTSTLAERIHENLDQALDQTDDRAALALVRQAYETLAGADRLRLPLVRTWIEPRVYELIRRFGTSMAAGDTADPAKKESEMTANLNILRKLAGHANLQLVAILSEEEAKSA